MNAFGLFHPFTHDHTYESLLVKSMILHNYFYNLHFSLKSFQMKNLKDNLVVGSWGCLVVVVVGISFFTLMTGDSSHLRDPNRARSTRPVPPPPLILIRI